MYHHAQLIFVFLVEMEFCHVGPADLGLLISDDLPASASQCAGITDMSHCTQPLCLYRIEFYINLYTCRYITHIRGAGGGRLSMLLISDMSI